MGRYLTIREERVRICEDCRASQVVRGRFIAAGWRARQCHHILGPMRGRSNKPRWQEIVRLYRPIVDQPADVCPTTTLETMASADGRGRLVRTIGRLPRAAVQAAMDAGRAWAVVPNVFRKAVYARVRSGGWRVRHRRRFRLSEVLRRKLVTAIRTFVASLRLGLARHVIVTHYPEEGLLANLLHVLEVVRRVRPDARVHVDWTLTGTEVAFRYGEKGEDVWLRLFRAMGPPLAKTAHHAVARVDFAFWGTGKDHLMRRRLQRHREVYHSVLLEWLAITNPRVLAQVDEICTRHFHGRFCIGIHRRVGNVLVADLQADGRVPPPESIVRTVESIIAAATNGGMPDCLVYLATDDADAIGPFKNAFGTKLIVREDVQRTTADGPEVHFGEWGSLSLADAEDALIDTVLLSQCNVMVYTSSSVSTVASIMNPALILVRA